VHQPSNKLSTRTLNKGRWLQPPALPATKPSRECYIDAGVPG